MKSVYRIFSIILIFTMSLSSMVFSAEKIPNPNLNLPKPEPVLMTKGLLILEAEDMGYNKDIQLVEDNNASGGMALKTINIATDNDPDDDIYAEFTPDTPNTSYLWVRVKVLTESNDSLHWNYNQGAYSTKYFTSTSPEYRWEKFGSAVVNANTKTRLAFKVREAGLFVDKIILTDDVSFEPKNMDDIPGDIEANVDYTGLFPEPSIKPIEGHPRLTFTKNDIPRMLANLEHPNMASQYATLERAADREFTGVLDTGIINNVDSNTLITLASRALFYALGLRDANHAKTTIKEMTNALDTARFNSKSANITRSIGSLMSTAAAVYDWCYDQMSEEDKKFFIKEMKKFASMKEIGYPPLNQSSLGSHAGEGEIFGHLLSCGIAVYDEDPEIYNLGAGRMFSEFVESRKFLNNSGIHAAGHSYGMTRFEWELAGNQLYVGMGIKEGIFGGTEDIARISKRMIYSRLPVGAYMKWGDDWMWCSASNFRWSWWTYAAGTYNLAASQTDDPYVLQASLMDMHITGATPFYKDIISILTLTDPDKQGKLFDELPLAQRTTYPYSSIIARTNWKMGLESNAAIVQLEASEKRLQNHDHADLGSFQLYYKGYLTGNAGLYSGKNGEWGGSHYWNYYTRSIAHNCMTIFDPNEKFKNYYYPEGNPNYGAVYSNDGGQKHSEGWQTASNPDGFQEYLDIEDYAKTDAWYIGPNEETPEFSFIKTDLTNAYNGSEDEKTGKINKKVANHERSMVFMDLDNDDYPAALIVFDDVESTNKDFKKTYNMQAVLEPTIDGTKTVLDRNDNGQNGRLVHRTMLPENPVIEAVGGEGKESYVNGINYPNAELQEGSWSDQGSWRVEISPSTASEKDYFLNAMYVTDYDRNLPELPMYKEETVDLYGVTVRDRTVYFSKADKINTTQNIVLRDNGFDEVKCLVTDINSGLWKVTNKADGSFKVYAADEEKNSLYFRASPGEYTISKVSGEATEKTVYEKMSKPEYGDFMVYDSATLMYIPLDSPTVKNGDAKLVPMRQVFEYSDLDVNYNNGEIKVTGPGIDIKVAIGDNKLYTGSRVLEMKTAPTIINGSTYVDLDDFPIFKTKYDDRSRILEIKSSSFKLYDEKGFKNYVIPVSVEAIGNDGNIESNMFDGMLSTRWSYEGKERWAIFTLEESYTIDSIAIAYHVGDQRQSYFDIEVSDDGINYTKVLTGAATSGKTLDFETFKLPAGTKGKYIKLVGNGNSKNLWNSVAEFMIIKGE